MSKARAYCFTYNNPQEFNYAGIACKFIIVGAEIAPETKTPHHQGYVLFKSPMTFQNAKNKLPPGSHIEVSNGSPQHNITYCSKESIFYENGERPKQGKRNDIQAVKECIDTGGGMKDIIDITDSYQAMKTGELILKFKERKRNFKPVVKWYYGATGTGKTKRAFEETKDPWISGRNLQWWCGYDAHKHVIIDDFRGDFCTFHELLRILDRYPYTVQNKGGSRQLLAELIIITCPRPPNIVYETREDIQQLLRRIDIIECLDVRDSMSATTELGTDGLSSGLPLQQSTPTGAALSVVSPTRTQSE